MIPLVPLIGIAASLVPELVRVVGGDKAGAVAKNLGAAATTIFGTEDAAQVKAQIGLDPDKANAFRLEVLRITAEQEKAIREAELQEVMARLVDVQNARQQTVALAQAGSPIAWGPVVISVVMLVLSGAVVALPRLLPEAGQYMSETDKSMLLVAAIGWVAIVGNYWLGSSAGSQQKNALIQQLTKG